MIKPIGGKMYFCCPYCGQKLHEITRGANCHGVLTYCKKCKREVPMEIKTEKGA